MAAPKRTQFQKEHDYERITAYYLKGEYQSAIAEKLGVTQQQISLDIKTIQARWRKSTTFNLDEHKAKELAKLDELEREYWRAWLSSTEERTRERNKTTGTKTPQGAIQSARGEVSKETEQRDGNPAFLTGVLSCIDRRVKILGLDAPVKGENTDTVTFKVVYGEE